MRVDVEQRRGHLRDAARGLEAREVAQDGVMSPHRRREQAPAGWPKAAPGRGGRARAAAAARARAAARLSSRAARPETAVERQGRSRRRVGPARQEEEGSSAPRAESGARARRRRASRFGLALPPSCKWPLTAGRNVVVVLQQTHGGYDVMMLPCA